MEIEKGGYPFKKEDLQRADLPNAGRSIRKLVSAPGKVIREEGLMGNVPEELEKRIEKLKKRISGLKNACERMQRNGVSIPNPRFVLGRNEKKQEKIFTIVDLVEGVRFDQVQDLNEDECEKVDKVFSALLGDVLTAYENGESFFWDLHSANFMYGKIEGENSEQLYLIDLGSDGAADPQRDDYRDDVLQAAYLIGQQLWEFELALNIPRTMFPKTTAQITKLRLFIQEKEKESRKS